MAAQENGPPESLTGAQALVDAVPVPPAGSAAVVEVLGRYSLEVHFSRLSPQDAAKKAMEEAKSALL